jgi:hypothetical protein
MTWSQAVDDRSPKIVLLTVAVALFAFSVLSPSAVAGAQTNQASSSGNQTSTSNTIAYVPPPTGCTLPGYTAPASLIITLGTKPTTTPGALVHERAAVCDDIP